MLIFAEPFPFQFERVVPEWNLHTHAHYAKQNLCCAVSNLVMGTSISLFPQDTADEVSRNAVRAVSRGRGGVVEGGDGGGRWRSREGMSV